MLQVYDNELNRAGCIQFLLYFRVQLDKNVLSTATHTYIVSAGIKIINSTNIEVKHMLTLLRSFIYSIYSYKLK